MGGEFILMLLERDVDGAHPAEQLIDIGPQVRQWAIGRGIGAGAHRTLGSPLAE